MADESFKNKHPAKIQDDGRPGDGDRPKNQHPRFAEYTLLNSSREEILHECFNTDLKKKGYNSPNL